ncbi:hypothetical protein [Parasitella parasitica]|uniref:Uncharacterized protein n=1 Tax=Parasitella parasitica TaxID=35722 RepID=A0A0B7MN36_9FUNG|nr:hypothetical protein [Parasitella parasitica]
MSDYANEITDKLEKSLLSVRELRQNLYNAGFHSNFDPVTNEDAGFMEVTIRVKYCITQRSDWAVKHWRASLWQQRFNSYADVLQREQEDVSAEDVSTENVSIEEDAPRRRIHQFKQLTKSALFEDKDITVECLADKMGEINDKETNAILKIITFQFPFLFITNQVLHSLGYLDRAVKFTPVIKPASLHALWVDPTTLHSLFCAQKLERKMVLYDFEGNIIRAASVTSQKDAISSSLFDIDRLKTVCAGSRLQFAHRIHILPGLRCVRILGVRNYQQPKHKQKEQQQPVAQTTSGSDDKGNDMIATLVEQKAVIQRKLQNTQTALNNHLVGAEKPGCRAWLYQRIQEAKQRTRHLIRDVVSAKQELSTTNNAIYKLKHGANPSTKNKQRKAFIGLKKPYNDVVNVTETVAFGVDRLKHHLHLYSHFQMLQDENDTFMEESKDDQFQELPQSFEIRSAEIRQQSGLASYSTSLNRRKRLSVLGQQVADYEADLS